MTDLNELQSRFNTVAHANKRSALSQEQFDLLVRGESPSLLAWLDKLVRATGQGNPEAIDTFKMVHTTVRITDALQSSGFPDACKRSVRAMIDAQGVSRVGNATQALLDHDEQSRHEIRSWLQAAKAQVAPAESPEAQESTSDRHGTDQRSPQGQSPASSRFSQVPPPPGVRTAQVSTRTNTGSRHDNVHHLPQQSRAQSPAPTRDDPRTQTRDHAQYSGTQSRQGGDQPGKQRQYDQHACFGKDVAVQFQNCPTKDGSCNTVMIKIARAKADTCKKGVDWDNGILINLEPHEVQTCTAVLLGYGQKVRYAGHGPANDKWFEMAETTDDWAGAIRLQVGQKDDKRAVNIGPTDVGEVAALFLRAMNTQMRVAPAMYPLILRRAYDLYHKNAERLAARRNQGGGGRYQGGHQHQRQAAG